MLYIYLNKNFVCKKCRRMIKNFEEPDEILCDGVEIVSKFCYLDDRYVQLVGAKQQ